MTGGSEGLAMRGPTGQRALREGVGERGSGSQETCLGPGPATGPRVVVLRTRGGAHDGPSEDASPARPDLGGDGARRGRVFERNRFARPIGSVAVGLPD